MDNYLQSKLLLFSKYLSRSSSAKAIINHDNPSYEHFINTCPSNSQIDTYGLSKKTQNSFVTNDIKTSLNGTKYIVLLPSGETRRIHLNIHGNFNVYNSVACIAACFTTYSHLLTLDQIIQSLENFQYVKGRFEFHIRHRPFSVVVDFTHTPDGLEKVLKCGRQILLESAENGRLILVASYSANLASELAIEKSKDIISGIDDLKNGRIPFNRIGISEGTAAEDYHLRKISEGTLNYHRLISEKVIYDSLLAYIIDAYFMDSGIAEYFTNNIYCNLNLIGNDYMHKIYM
ncbi:unnamed protein product [Rotaria sp. Silwood2]|nr:unnamed protein product [Rotaria sp. Silwood2]